MVPVMAAIVVTGGRTLKGSESVITVDQLDPGADAMAQQAAVTLPEEPATSAIAAPQPPKPATHSRAIDPEIVAPPELPADGLERIEPREPLSKLALAVPPKP
ncbi:thermonuclease family protein, partial [Mesorhizobium sp. M7A.F.Ca.US.001.01.1.1]